MLETIHSCALVLVNTNDKIYRNTVHTASRLPSDGPRMKYTASPILNADVAENQSRTTLNASLYTLDYVPHPQYFLEI